MNVTTINVRGLNNPQKRSTILQWLQYKQFDIICLQETFLTADSIIALKNEWNGPSFHSPSPSNHSKGVSILINKSFSCEILNVYSSEDGRKVLLNLKHNDNTYSIANVYAPTDPAYRINFFNECRKWIKDRATNTSYMLVCGDFNCSLGSIDRLQENVDKSRKSFKDFINYLELHDSFREINKTKCTYTYSNKLGNIQSRIDYILCSGYLMGIAKKSYTLTPPRVPDHKAVVTSFRDDIERGKGYWKFNAKLLEDKKFQTMIRNIIHSVRIEYSDSVDKRTLWDLCKIRIKEESIKWSKTKYINLHTQKKQLEHDIEKIEQLMSTTNDKKYLETLRMIKNYSV